MSKEDLREGVRTCRAGLFLVFSCWEERAEPRTSGLCSATQH